MGYDEPQDGSVTINAWLHNSDKQCLLLLEDSGVGKTLVANLIEKQKLKPVKMISQKKAAKKLIRVIDVSHLKSKSNACHSFEAMIAAVFRQRKSNLY